MGQLGAGQRSGNTRLSAKPKNETMAFRIADSLPYQPIQYKMGISVVHLVYQFGFRFESVDESTGAMRPLRDPNRLRSADISSLDGHPVLPNLVLLQFRHLQLVDRIHPASTNAPL